ncbi:MAG: 3-hydroxyacyl-CoA dehydrogenase family protein [Acetobacteraceae bacterium]|nr:3-hydroxyacyl-CoA dehydrogenase family protein [Acetobacteraceae bacterium]
MADVAVIGAGTMGHALALVFALGGHRVRLTDNNPATLDRAPRLMQAALASLVEAGEADRSWTAERLQRAVTCVAEAEETVRGADLVIEAIIEQPEVKRRLFAGLDPVMRPDAILASNTSYLDPFPLMPEHRLPRAIIAHWYTPPYLVDLVDIVPNPKTDPAVVEQVRGMIAAMGKKPIVFKQIVPGYVANRIQAAIGLEVYRLLDEGLVTPREIDDSVIHGLALRWPVLGVLAKADFTGLALLQDALRHRTYEPPPLRDNCDTLDRLIAEGRTGVAARAGFFDWGGRSPEELYRERDRKLLALKKAMRAVGSMEPS